MNRKLLISTIAMIFTMSVANAASDKVHVAILEDFDTANPEQHMDVRVLEVSTLGTYILKPDDIIHCNVVKVTDPKRGKRTATFAVCPVSYTSNGETTTINEKYYGKYASKIISKEEIRNINAKKAGKKAAISVGNYFVKGVAPAISMAEGMIKNEEGNRIESGVKQVYKDSPLSYVEKGEELELNTGDTFYLIFKSTKD